MGLHRNPLDPLVAEHEKAPGELGLIRRFAFASDAVANSAIAEFGFSLGLQGCVVGIDVFDAAISLSHQPLSFAQGCLFAHLFAGDFEGVHG